jgi:putative copper export protein
LMGSSICATLSRTLTGFESAGALIVASLAITGIANYVLIVGPEISGVMKSTYGSLLALKIALFGEHVSPRRGEPLSPQPAVIAP